MQFAKIFTRYSFRRLSLSILILGGLCYFYWVTMAPLNSTLVKNSAPSEKLISSPSIEAPLNESVPSLPPAISSTANAKLKLVQEILSSKNDNDPRFDTELRTLDAEDKRALQGQYKAYAPEARNERGTLVFLIGRNLTSEDDFLFLADVLQEQPCLSFADCNERMKDSGDPHLEGPMSISLNYPQIVAMNRIEAWIVGTDVSSVDRSLTTAAFRTLQAATLSPIAQVAQKARDLLLLLKSKAG